MNVSNQRAISARLLRVGQNKVWFDKTKLQEIKEAITKADIRRLIKRRIIQARPEQGTSRARARVRLTQRRKGRQKGEGTRKGKRTARLARKRTWMLSVRAQRGLVQEIRSRDLIDVKTYRQLRSKIKGGYFRNRRHIKLYLTEHKLFQEKKK